MNLSIYMKGGYEEFRALRPAEKQSQLKVYPERSRTGQYRIECGFII